MTVVSEGGLVTVKVSVYTTPVTRNGVHVVTYMLYFTMSMTLLSRDFKITYAHISTM